MAGPGCPLRGTGSPPFRAPSRRDVYFRALGSSLCSREAPQHVRSRASAKQGIRLSALSWVVSLNIISSQPSPFMIRESICMQNLRFIEAAIWMTNSSFATLVSNSCVQNPHLSYTPLPPFVYIKSLTISLLKYYLLTKIQASVTYLSMWSTSFIVCPRLEVTAFLLYIQLQNQTVLAQTTEADRITSGLSLASEI